MIVCLWIAARWISSHKSLNILGGILALAGLWIWGDCAYNFIKYRNGKSIPQFTTPTRILYSLYILDKEITEIENLAIKNLEFINSSKTESTNENLILCLIIGESHSVFHMPAYGYQKNTMPLIGEMMHNKEGGKIFWFNDVISIADHTHTAMKSIFITQQESEGGQQLMMLPTPFKAMGYHNSLYDNQYLPGQGVSFMSNETLSNAVYDKRNSSIMSDEELIDLRPADESGNHLMIYHLMGSHYTYSSRYPHERFSIFKPNDYPSDWDAERREITAHYDNSIAYTDFVLTKLINRLKDKRAAIVYISDHGEEVYDNGNYIGHGNAARVQTIDHQIRIPMMVWISESYIDTYPNSADMLVKSVDRPWVSEKMTHLLIDLAHEESPAFDSTQSIINANFSPSKRIVLHSIDFDAQKKEHLPMSNK